MNSEAWQEGYTSYWNETEKTENPYLWEDSDFYDFIDWHNGWETAEQEVNGYVTSEPN